MPDPSAEIPFKIVLEYARNRDKLSSRSLKWLWDDPMEINCQNWCNVFIVFGEDACEDERCPNADLLDELLKEK